MADTFDLNLGWVVAGLLFCLFVYMWFRNREWKIRFEQKVTQEISDRESEIRKDSAARSGRTLSGKTLEKLVPFLKDFGHDPHDVRWMGDPVDLVVFDGYSKSGRKSVEGVTFVEVKSGDSEMSPGQKGIRDAVQKKKVRWEEFRI
jgi:predicted Holliday junction resolvase-like endonuclease